MSSTHASDKVYLAIGTIVVLVFLSLFYIFPVYLVWQAEQSGRASLAEAVESRKIAVEEAKAKLESAKLYTQAEVERAKGVAEANKIIGVSLKDNEAYRWRWIESLSETENQVIYVPTETQLPILEAGRLPLKHRR